MTAQPHRPNTLLVLRHTPYGRGPGRSGVEAALAFAAFEQNISLLFLGTGTLQLLPNQSGRDMGHKSISKMLASLPLYDIPHVYVDVVSATRYGVDLRTSPVPAKTLDKNGIQQLLSKAQHILSF